MGVGVGEGSETVEVSRVGAQEMQDAQSVGLRLSDTCFGVSTGDVCHATTISTATTVIVGGNSPGSAIGYVATQEGTKQTDGGMENGVRQQRRAGRARITESDGRVCYLTGSILSDADARPKEAKR